MHKNKVNGKVYIGQTCQTKNPNLRWQNGKHYEGNPYITNAVNKYGWENFEHIILKDGVTTKAEIDELEKEYIKLYNANDPNFGYNILEGGGGHPVGVPLSEETKRKLSEKVVLFKQSVEYEGYIDDLRDKAKERWATMSESDRALQIAKSRKARQEKDAIDFTKPICRLKTSRRKGKEFGRLYIGEVYLSVEHFPCDEKERTMIVRSARRYKRKSTTIKFNKSDYFANKNNLWVFVEDALFIVENFNPVVKLSENGGIVKIWKSITCFNKSNRKKIIKAEDFELLEFNKKQWLELDKNNYKILCQQSKTKLKPL